jgi:hypothetical protein
MLVKKAIKVNLKVLIYLKGEPFEETKINLPDYPNVASKQEVSCVCLQDCLLLLCN